MESMSLHLIQDRKTGKNEVDKHLLHDLNKKPKKTKPKQKTKH